MTKISLLFSAVLLLLYAGCSTSEKTTTNNEEIQNDEQVSEAVSPAESRNKAMEYFINGSILETKGDYAGAILEFQDALKYDTSAGIYYALGKNYFYLDKTPQALLYTKKAVQLNPEPA